LGKFAPEWQNYLQSKSDIHRDEISGRVDHATAGAQHAVATGNIFGHSSLIRLLGTTQDSSTQSGRMRVCKSDLRKNCCLTQMLLITTNQFREIQASGYAPGDGRESAIIADLPAGN
jgi:hypothetical protein